MSDFITRLANARGVVSQARKELATAELHCQPISADLVQIFLEHKPVEYAQCLRRVADIAATLPALRTAVVDAEVALAPIEKLACHRCSGTGRYDGPTNATRRGVPYCFYCDGHGCRKAK